MIAWFKRTLGNVKPIPEPALTQPTRWDWHYHPDAPPVAFLTLRGRRIQWHFPDEGPLTPTNDVGHPQGDFVVLPAHRIEAHLGITNEEETPR